MGRQKQINAASRAQEYKSEGFYIYEKNSVMCKYCNLRLEWRRRDSCEKHVTSQNHIAQKACRPASAVPIQASLSELLAKQSKSKDEKTAFILETTAMLLKLSSFFSAFLIKIN